MRNSYCLAVVAVLFLCLHVDAQQQGSVGIGTETPNPNAVLHVVSPGNNQGLLIPSLTTAQRTSTSFTDVLGVAENGLLVFDSEERQFYFWEDTEWRLMGATGVTPASTNVLTYDSITHMLTLSGGNEVDLSALSDVFSGSWNDLTGIPIGLSDGVDHVEDADADPTNELQDLQLVGNVLSITGNPNATEVILSDIVDTDDQSLTFSSGVITLSDDPSATPIDLSAYDTDASDDFSGAFGDLTGFPTGSDGEVLKLSGGSWAAGTDAVDDADNDPANEIQDLDFTGGVLSLSNDPTPVSIDLSGYDADASDDFSGSFDDLTGFPAGSDGEVLKLSGGTWAAGTDAVDDADSDPANEIQDLDFTGGILSLGNDPTPVSIDLSGYDADASDDFSGVFGDLTGFPTGSDGEVLKLSGGAWAAGADAVDDADSDPSNEIQDLDFTGGILTLSNDPTPVSIDLSGYDSDASDDFNGNWSSLSGVPAGFSDGIDNTGSTSPWTSTTDDNSNEIIDYSGIYARANNFVSTPLGQTIVGSDIESGVIRAELIKSAKVVLVNPDSPTALQTIESGANGQELILVVVGTGTLNVDGETGNLYLSATPGHALTNASTLHLIYIDDEKGTGLKGWLELSVSIGARGKG